MKGFLLDYMGLKQQRNLGYGLLGFGVALMTGYGLSAYGQGIVFLGVVLLTGIVLAFLTMRDATNLKGTNAEITFKDAVQVIGSLYGLIFLGFVVVVLLGIIKGI